MRPIVSAKEAQSDGPTREPAGEARAPPSRAHRPQPRRQLPGRGRVRVRTAAPSRKESTLTALDTARIASTAAQGAPTDGAIRPFRVQIPDEALADLRRRLAATR